MPPEPRQLTLYVRSKKAVTTFYRPPVSPTASGGTGVLSTGTGETRGADSGEALGDNPVYFLSDDQARCVAIVEEFAQRRGYELKVVDVERTGRLERLLSEHLRGVQNFPVLIGPNGQRLEGIEAFNDERLAAIMPTELRDVVRAFTYLKLRGGDFGKIQATLQGLEPVKEMHFLTGDWDVFLVLEFYHPTARKRGVLDFVTDTIRKIPEVVDTSTIVPEYSITKFPLLESERGRRN